LSLAVQCQLLGLSRSTWYERASEPSLLNVELMRRLDEEYTAHPFYGSRRMMRWLHEQGYQQDAAKARAGTRGAPTFG